MAGSGAPRRRCSRGAPIPSWVGWDGLTPAQAARREGHDGLAAGSNSSIEGRVRFAERGVSATSSHSGHYSTHPAAARPTSPPSLLQFNAAPTLNSVRSLHDPWTSAALTIPNRVMLAPLAGIGNWFVRLQAKRYGAGLAVSEMISSFAIHYGNRKTLDELLVVHPDEGPVAIQLFGQDPEIMRSAAARGRSRRRRHPRPEHGLPGPEGDEDRRGRGAHQGPGHGRRGGQGRPRGLRPPGHREAARRR